MSYDEHDAPAMDKLCLYGELAKDYMRVHVGETVKMTVTAVVTCVSSGKPSSVEEEAEPCVEFEVLEVEGGKKPYAEMSNAEIEGEISNVKNEEQAEGEPQSTVPNREDGGSIWTDMKRQEKVGRKASKRPRPIGFR